MPGSFGARLILALGLTSLTACGAEPSTPGAGATSAGPSGDSLEQRFSTRVQPFGFFGP